MTKLVAGALGFEFRGLHVLAELKSCRPQQARLLQDKQGLATLCVALVRSHGLQCLDQVFHSFGPGQGVTGIVLLAESHLAVHTWPETGAVTLDVFVCNQDSDNSDKARALMQALLSAFSPAQHQLREVVREFRRD